MEELIKQIEALMSDNEAVKNNALKSITTKTGNDQRSTEIWSKAKAENVAYQNVLDLINNIVVKEVDNG